MATRPFLRLLMASFMSFAHAAQAQVSLPSAEGWKLERVEDGIEAYSRASGSGRLREFKAVATVPAAAEAVFAALKPCDSLLCISPAYRNFIHIQPETETEAWVYYQMKTPAFSRDRDLVGHLVYGKQKNAYTLQMVAMPDLYPMNPSLIRLTEFRLTFYVEPLTPATCRITTWGVGDPGGDIPAAFVNLTLLDYPMAQIRYLRRKTQAPAPAAAKPKP